MLHLACFAFSQGPLQRMLCQIIMRNLENRCPKIHRLRLYVLVPSQLQIVDHTRKELFGDGLQIPLSSTVLTFPESKTLPASCRTVTSDRRTPLEHFQFSNGRGSALRMLSVTALPPDVNTCFT